MYRKLKRVWSYNSMNYIKGFREKFPELSKVSSEELADRWCDLGIELYTQEVMEVSKWMRLTLPLAIVFIILMIVGLPINFMLTGRWNYPWKDDHWTYNWLRSLHLVQ